MICSLCLEGRKGLIWEPNQLLGLKYLLDNGMLCTAHQIMAKEEIKKMPKEPKKEILKTGEPKQFIPPVPEEPFHNYQDEREPGMDDQ